MGKTCRRGGAVRKTWKTGATQGVGGKVSHPDHGNLCRDHGAEAHVGPEGDGGAREGPQARAGRIASPYPESGAQPAQERTAVLRTPTFPHRPTHSTEVFLASLCPMEQDVRAARRSMVPFIWTRSQTCGAGAGQRETEPVRERERQGQRETEAHRERQNQGETHMCTGAHAHSPEIRNREALRHRGSPR